MPNAKIIFTRKIGKQRKQNKKTPNLTEQDLLYLCITILYKETKTRLK